MSSYRDFYGSSYLKASDLRGKPGMFSVVDVVPEKFRDEPRPKLVASLKETDKRFVLNQTNATSFEEIFGCDSYGNWRGQVVLYRDTTDFGGRRVDCIRARAPQQTQHARASEEDDVAVAEMAFAE